MMRYLHGRALGPVLALLAVAACTPTAETTGTGIGFASPETNAAAPATGFDPAIVATAIDRADGTATPVPPNLVTDNGRPRGGAPDGIQEESGEVSHIGISDEQDFNAVAERETIESDAERIARNRAQYVIVQPTALPTRPGDTGPNIVEFALATTHAPGVQLYQRSSLGLRDPNAACAKYTSSDKAQQDFLARGGPDRDRLGLDPDGDGFACAWDPRPFRTALQ